MKILTINGSSRIGSINQKLVEYLHLISQDKKLEFYDISKLPLFRDIAADYPQPVLDWRTAINEADAVMITSPEYLSNVPAALKNALEWLNEESNLAEKKVLPIIFTPKQPRGDKAMQSLLWSLQSLHAQILPSLSLYHHDFTSVNTSLQANAETLELIKACFENFDG